MLFCGDGSVNVLNVMQLLLLKQIMLQSSMSACNMLHAGDKRQRRLLPNVVILFCKKT